MSSMRLLITTEIDLMREIKYRNEIAELARADEFIAARKLQAWFRGFITRKHFRMLHKSATTIQRHFRGFMARKFAKSHLEDRVKTMWRNYYNQCATKIQALWRGYRARKNGVNLAKYRQWLQTVYDKNEDALTQMKQFRNSESAYTREVMERESMNWILFILFKLHHLLRTKCQPGVLTRIDKTRFTAIEKMMRSVEYTLYMEKRRRDKCNEPPPEPTPLLFEGTYFARCEKEIRDLERRIKLGKISIRRDTPYEEREKLLKNVENLRGNSTSTKRHDPRANSVPFKTFTGIKIPACAQYNSMVRVTTGDYNTAKQALTSICRSPRDKSKELHGDFKVVVKSNELYDAINQMDCPFFKLKLKCPIHD